MAKRQDGSRDVARDTPATDTPAADTAPTHASSVRQGPGRKQPHGYRLTRQEKLLKAADYQYVFDRALRSSDAFFTVLARVNNNGHARLGMAFSKKRVRLAVARNRLKRITRESFRLTKDKYKADYVVLAGPHCVKASNRQLFQSLENHWQKLSQQCEKSS